MSVKDVLQSLVDDGMVDSDRIGTSNYFWAFPSKASNQVYTHWKLCNESLNSSSHDMATIYIYTLYMYIELSGLYTVALASNVCHLNFDLCPCVECRGRGS